MTEFGKTLKDAREAKGLTPSQISEQTHLLPQIVEDLENEDFHRISAPIYGRGFVKLYCEAVGLDPKPLVDEFMAILSGERQPAIKIREVELPPDAPPEPVEPPPPPRPVYTQPELGESEDEVVRHETRDAMPQDARQETRDASKDLRPETAVPEAPRQYHPGYAQSAPVLGRAPNFGRLAILAGGAIAFIVLLVWGARALYRASMGTAPVDAVSSPRPAETQAEPDAKSPEAKAKPAEVTQVKRQPKEVPALYID